jgi:hypothetical protein
LNRQPSIRAGFIFAVITTIILGAGSCAVPLAPGYQISRRALEIQFVPGAGSKVGIHDSYTLVNSGNAPLTFIDVVFPDENAYGRSGLKVEWDGQAATPEELPEEYQPGSPGALRLNFRSPWNAKEKRNLVVDYTLSEPAGGNGTFVLGPESFFLGTGGWLVDLLPPNHILATAPAPLSKTVYSVRVPNDFKVFARGSSAGEKRDGSEKIYSFALTPKDAVPFVIAGRYDSSAGGDKSGATVWSAAKQGNLPPAASKRFGSAWQILQKNFGVLNKREDEPLIVEAPNAGFGDRGNADENFPAFPGGVFINSGIPDGDPANKGFYDAVESALARTWFGDALVPAPAARIALGEGLPVYAAIVIDQELDGEAGRRRRIAQLLNQIEEARQNLKASEKSVTATNDADSREQKRIARAKAALLFIDLEDSAGANPVRLGLAQAIQFLSGKEVTINDVRAAIEFTTGKNLAAVFRNWLYTPGVPADFRARYAGPAETAKSN